MLSRFPVVNSLVVAAVLLFAFGANAQDTTKAAPEPPVVLMSGLGHLHHAVTTSNPEAQKFFDQALTLVYAFNHEDAIRSFRKAIELDSTLAMAHWGIAYALGPNINFDVDSARELQAYDEIHRALALASHASPVEQAYISALAVRYSNDPKVDHQTLNLPYTHAMKEVMNQFPDDPDAAVLYVESVMDLNPWKLYNRICLPIEGTEEIVSILESVLKRFPDHPGANHYYIHCTEASRHPERALPEAKRLATLCPSAGHLVHMPAHVYVRLGDYKSAASANLAAMKADSFYLNNGTQGIYPLMYYNHNVHFFAVACSMIGRYDEARRAASELLANITPVVRAIPFVEGYMPTPLIIDVRFHKWDDLINYPRPDTDLHIMTAIWHFARGTAYAETAHPEKAVAEETAFNDLASRLPSGAMIGYNSAGQVCAIASKLLRGHIAQSKGSTTEAINAYREAVAITDTLNYDEPESWYVPAREFLGGALLANKQFAEAEQVFKADLVKHPHSPRSLFGLHETLVAEKKMEEAGPVQKDLDTVWAGPKLTMADLQ